MRRVACYATLLAGALALAACSDQPLAISPDAAAALTSRESANVKEPEAHCTIIRYDGPLDVLGPKEHVVLPLPTGAQHPDGQILRYKIEARSDDDRVDAEAWCTIPRTLLAFAITNHAFGITDGVRARLRGRDHTYADGSVGILGCVSDGFCVLDPITVIAPPACSRGDCWPRGDDPGEEDDPGAGEDPGSGESPPSPDDPCNTGYAALDHPEVQAGFANLWSSSYPSAAMADRRERGGWLMQRPDGSHFIQSFPESWPSTSCGIEIPDGILPPNGTVAMVHTHPYERGEVLTGCGGARLNDRIVIYPKYEVEPSPDDFEAMENLRTIPGVEDLIGIVLDAEKIHAYTGTGETMDFPRCGY